MTPLPTVNASIPKLLDALQLFIDSFGKPATELDLKATVGALLSVIDAPLVAKSEDRSQGDPHIHPEIEVLIEQVVAAFKERQLRQGALKQAVTKVKDVLKQQESDLINITSAYVQKFAPKISQSELADVVRTAVAVMCDQKITVSEGRSLVAKVLKSFDLDLALRRWVPPQFLQIAQRVATYRQKADFEADILSIAQAYIQQFSTTLGPALIRHILESGNTNIDPRALAKSNLTSLSKTLYLKFQLLEASPKVTKSHEAMAKEVHQSVQAFQALQANQSASSTSTLTDVSKPSSTGDLEISSPLLINQVQKPKP